MEPFGYEVEDIIAAADAHDAESPGDAGCIHAYGDLIDVLSVAWRHMTPAQKRAVVADERVQAVLSWSDNGTCGRDSDTERDEGRLTSDTTR